MATEVQEVVEVDAMLDALDAPSSTDVVLATIGHSERAIAAVAAQRALAGGGGGGSQAGAAITHRIPFAYNTAGILTGASLYTPTIGDLLLDLWVEINTLWDGTTPFMDIGTFDHVATGIFQSWWGAALQLDNAADAPNQSYSCLSQGGSLSSIRDLVSIAMPTAFNDSLFAVSGANVNLNNTPASGNRVLPARFVSATPLKVCVSQTGANDGASPGSTAGAGALCLVTSTPATS